MKRLLITTLLLLANFCFAQNPKLKWYNPKRLSLKGGAYHVFYFNHSIQSRSFYYHTEMQYMVVSSNKLKIHVGGGLQEGFTYYFASKENTNLLKGEKIKYKPTLMIAARMDFGTGFHHHLEFAYTPLGSMHYRSDYYYHLNYLYGIPSSLKLGKLLKFQPVLMLGVTAFSTKRGEGGYRIWPLDLKTGIQFILQ